MQLRSPNELNLLKGLRGKLGNFFKFFPYGLEHFLCNSSMISVNLSTVLSKFRLLYSDTIMRAFFIVVYLKVAPRSFFRITLPFLNVLIHNLTLAQ